MYVRGAWYGHFYKTPSTQLISHTRGILRAKTHIFEDFMCVEFAHHCSDVSLEKYKQNTVIMYSIIRSVCTEIQPSSQTPLKHFHLWEIKVGSVAMRSEISLYSRVFFAVGLASESCKNCSRDVEDSHLIFPCLSDLVALYICRKGGKN